MRLTFVVMAAVLIAGCKQQPQQPPRQQKVSDAEIAEMHRDMPGMTDACLDKLKWGGSEGLPRQYEDCFKFTPSQRMQGLWRNNFEGSEYCDGSSGQCPDAKANAETGIWLAMRSPLPGVDDTPPGGLYAIDFIGRRSIGAGMFGHMGMAKNEVIVDRLLSIKEVEPPPSQAHPTRAELIREMKTCEAKGACIPNWSLINDYDPEQMKKARIASYLKECAGKPICMPNSEVTKSK
ncbi:MAG: hypothetical protein HOP91_03810 [Sphingomonas sp.]|nr:hypothetical protein [Sphingomonas sp.]